MRIHLTSQSRARDSLIVSTEFSTLAPIEGVDDLSFKEEGGDDGMEHRHVVVVPPPSVVGWTEKEADVQLVALEKDVRRGRTKLSLSYRSHTDRHIDSIDMDKFRRAFSATKMAQQDSDATASNNNGQAIESLAKSSSNTFGIPVRLQFNPTSMFKFRKKFASRLRYSCQR